MGVVFRARHLPADRIVALKLIRTDLLSRFDEAIPLLEEACRSSAKSPSLRWVPRPLLDEYVKAKQLAKAAALMD